MHKPVGIDLGTTYSVVAVMRDDGAVEVLRNREGETTTPSVVLFDPDEAAPLVGAEAKNLGGAMPERIVEMVKRSMGRQIEWEFDGRIYTAAEISGMILAKLKADAEHRLGEPVRDAVVTVPAYFANDEREATRQAAEQAGLNVLQIINEPTSAAIAYRLGKSPSAQTILVYDLGGGTFDVTLMEVTAAGIDVLSTEGEVELGGKDWDDLLVHHVSEAFQVEHGVDPCDDSDAYQSLVSAAESAKRSLTERNKVTIPIRVGGRKSMVSVPRESFEAMAGPLVERTRSTVAMVLGRTNKSPDQIQRVLLVGGSTRMPMIRAMLNGIFAGRVDATINPDECVAVGAAMQAARLTMSGLSPSARAGLSASARGLLGVSIRDITAHSLGTAVVRDDALASSFIIAKDTAIPAEVKRDDYVTTRDNQDTLVVPVLQGESDDPRANRLLACHEFLGIPPRPAGASRLEVVFRYNASGIVEVDARDIGSGQMLQRTARAIEDLDELMGSKGEPLAVALLIDTSGSMSGRPIEHAKRGAITFIDELLGEGDASGGNVEVGVVEFGQNIQVVADLGSQAAHARAAIQALGTGNGTPMREAIQLAHQMLSSRSGKRVMVLLTDGEPGDRSGTIAKADDAREDDITIIALSCPGADEQFLAQICTPGVDVRSVTDTSQLREEFGSLAAELSRGRGIRA